jgi:hypothetical protein
LEGAVDYIDGGEVRLGDEVCLGNGCTGVVIASFERHEFSCELNPDEWCEYKKGVLIKTNLMGLLLIDSPYIDLSLIRRKLE